MEYCGRRAPTMTSAHTNSSPEAQIGPRPRLILLPSLINRPQEDCARNAKPKVFTSGGAYEPLSGAEGGGKLKNALVAFPRFLCNLVPAQALGLLVNESGRNSQA